MELSEKMRRDREYLQQREVRRAEQRKVQAAENRRRFPFASELADLLAAGGIKTKLIHAKEGDHEVGTPWPASAKFYP